LVADITTIHDELQEVDLFDTLDRAQLARLARATRKISVADGARLFNYGDQALCFFHLRAGQLKLSRIARNGGEKVVAVVSPGKTFAHDAMFQNPTLGYPVTATAIRASELLSFEMGTVRRLLRDSHETCLKVLSDLSRQVHRQLDEIEILTLHDATCRLADYLVRQVPANVHESPSIQLTTPKAIIASRLGIQAETFSRILRRLVREHLITIKRHTIVIMDMDGLRKLIDL